MAVAVVGTPSGVFTASVSGGGDTTDTSTTGGASCNFVIGVVYWFEVAGTSVPTGRIGGSSTGVTMIGTKKSFFSDFQHMAWFYKVSPGTGALAWDVSFTGAVDDIYTGVIAFSGVDTSTPLGTEATFATGSSAAPSITIAGGGANDMNIAWCASRTNDTVGADGTEAFNIDTGGDRSSVLEYLAGAGQQMDFTQTSEQWGVRGIEVLATAAGTTIAPGLGSQSLTGRAMTIGWSVGMPDVP